MCRDTLVCRDGIISVSRETGVSHVCHENMVCRDKEEKKHPMSKPMPMHDVLIYR